MKELIHVCGVALFALCMGVLWQAASAQQLPGPQEVVPVECDTECQTRAKRKSFLNKFIYESCAGGQNVDSWCYEYDVHMYVYRSNGSAGEDYLADPGDTQVNPDPSIDYTGVRIATCTSTIGSCEYDPFVGGGGYEP